MTTPETRQKIYQQIEQLLPDQLNLLTEFLDFLQLKENKPSTPTQQPAKRKPGLHPDVFVMSDALQRFHYRTALGWVRMKLQAKM